jgi:hypothetical protein
MDTSNDNARYILTSILEDVDPIRREKIRKLLEDFMSRGNADARQIHTSLHELDEQRRIQEKRE